MKQKKKKKEQKTKTKANSEQGSRNVTICRVEREERGKEGERGGKLNLYICYIYIPIFLKNYITSRLKKYQPARFLLVG